MRFGIRALLYVLVLAAAALAAFGPAGVFAVLPVFACWSLAYWPGHRRTGMISGAVAALLFLGACALLLPALASAQQAAQQTTCRGFLTKIAIALHNYHDAYGSFPPAYTVDDRGQPMHSWRVLILPYLEESALYAAYDFDEPWDGPNNRKLADRIPFVFQCRAHTDRHRRGSCETQYLAVVGDETAWQGSRGAKLGDIDETSETLLVVEVHGQGVHWMEPRDLSLKDAVHFLGPDAPPESTGHFHESLFHRHYGRVRQGVYADCHTEGFFAPLPSDAAAALFTINDDGVLAESDHRDWIEAKEVRWEGVYAFSAFALIAVFPFAWWARKETSLRGDAAATRTEL
jgi:hypothetical protein